MGHGFSPDVPLRHQFDSLAGLIEHCLCRGKQTGVEVYEVPDHNHAHLESGDAKIVVGLKTSR